MKTFRIFTLVLGLLLVGFIPIIQAQEIFKPDQILTPDPKILIGKLDNGLTYYIRENKRP